MQQMLFGRLGRPGNFVVSVYSINVGRFAWPGPLVCRGPYETYCFCGAGISLGPFFDPLTYKNSAGGLWARFRHSAHAELLAGVEPLGEGFGVRVVGRIQRLPDRVVGLDMLTLSLVAFCALATLYFEQRAFLDVALVLALIGFLATVALARFAERVQDNDRKNGEDHD